MNKRAGFTLVEIMVVIAVIAILSGVIWVSLNNSTNQSRDAQRQADLRTMQAALELYKQEYGRYPEGCNAASWTGNWSGQIGSGYECPGNSPEYIVNDLSATAEVENFAPQFIPVLPTDPQLNDSETYSGYIYTTNPDGTVYKVMAINTVETEVTTNGAEGLGVQAHPFSRCGEVNSADDPCISIPDAPTGIFSYNESTSEQSNAQCTDVSQFGNDYAVYGGFAPRGFEGIWRNSSQAREYFSDVIHCK